MTFLIKYLVLVLLCILSQLSVAQTVNEIKANNQVYLWGEGSGSTLNKADQEALNMLINQISANVESNYTHLTKEIKNNDSYNFKESFEGVVKTFSAATLRNTERIVVSNEPNALVFRFIERNELSKIFEERKRKIIDFAQNAQRFHKANDIGYALRYYYWSLSLLRSHPYANDIRLGIEEEGDSVLLLSWLPIQMNDIFNRLNFRILNIEEGEKLKHYTLRISHKAKAVNNLDFSFWTGRDWSYQHAVKDGFAVIETDKSFFQDNLKIRMEYVYFNESSIDLELRDVLEKMDVVPFAKSQYLLPIKNAEELEIIESSTLPIGFLSEKVDEYENKINQIGSAVQNNNYQGIQLLFTNEGFEKFKKLALYGNARVVPNQEYNFYTFNEEVICRSLKMSFAFKTNNKRFVEDMVFYFNKDGLVSNVNFGLSKKAIEDILGNEYWDEFSRHQLVGFLENYKTAFAIKDLSFVEKVFDDNALIIIGHVIKSQPNIESKFNNSDIIKYNQLSKTQYINNLRHSFSSNEFINIRFEDNIVRKAGKGGEIYGIQIKQDYYSSNYGDSGYLFLMVDLNDTTQPIIHVRTWQPERNPDGSIYGLGDF